MIQGTHGLYIYIYLRCTWYKGPTVSLYIYLGSGLHDPRDPRSLYIYISRLRCTWSKGPTVSIYIYLGSGLHDPRDPQSLYIYIWAQVYMIQGTHGLYIYISGLRCTPSPHRSGPLPRSGYRSYTTSPLKRCRSGYRCIVSSNRCSAAVTAL